LLSPLLKPSAKTAPIERGASAIQGSDFTGAKATVTAPAMIVHALIDIGGGTVGYWLLREPTA